MAWLTSEDPIYFTQKPHIPDMDTLSYWLSRLEPIIRAEAGAEVIVVLANRCGVEENAVYAGTSAVLGIMAGEVRVYGILGRGEKELLVVDTSKAPLYKLIRENNSTTTQSSVSTVASISSVNTRNTACSTPDLDSFPATFDEEDITSPISPANGRRAAFFNYNRKEPMAPTQPCFPGPTSQNPFSRTMNQSESRSSRNNSRTRRSESPPSLDASGIQRPESPKSINASQTRRPASLSPNLKQQSRSTSRSPKPRITSRSRGLSEPPMPTKSNNINQRQEHQKSKATDNRSTVSRDSSRSRQRDVIVFTLPELIELPIKSTETRTITPEASQKIKPSDSDLGAGLGLTLPDRTQKHENGPTPEFKSHPLFTMNVQSATPDTPRNPIKSLFSQQFPVTDPKASSLPRESESSGYPASIPEKQPLSTCPKTNKTKSEQLPTTETQLDRPSPTLIQTPRISRRVGRYSLMNAFSSPFDQTESSFTRNSLGPRNRHIVPRPQSTVW